MEKLRSPAELAALRHRLAGRHAGKKVIALCSGTGCMANRSAPVFEALRDELSRPGLSEDVIIRRTGCHGFCERGPIVIVWPEKFCYLGVRPEDIEEIVSETILKGARVDRLLYADPATEERAPREDDIPFYRKQQRILLADNPRLDAESIEDYIALGGYAALARSLFEMTPEEVLEEIKRANLRGRGGGGFPAGVKWETTRNAPGEEKFVIVNADEGDPGAYMDRSLLEGNPHGVLEGLAIGAYAIGCRRGFVYVRQEYPIALQHVLGAIEQAEERGLLGDDILGSGFRFHVKVHRGAGAFVSGESSALVSAIEGLVGEPRPKYIRTAVSGLWGQPTNLNNVETWANVPHIINRGADWFAGIGTEGSPGTKIFSLVGKVRNTGLVEVPMGMTLRQIIFDIGGGIPGGKAFKAVQTGGPSGGCLPASHLDLPVDFDALTEAGSMMGSGGMIVMDEDSCMVDVARYFTSFLTEESCGKCIPCREGLDQMQAILTRITEGEGREGDIELLEDLGVLLREASLCALGTTAPNPVLSTIRYFHGEYEAHILQRRCPARVCPALISFRIDPERCSGCMLCRKNCPVEAIRGERKKPHEIDLAKCIKCGMCLEVCPDRFAAVEKVSPVLEPVAGPAASAEGE